jgi:tetratricopeptide (TPR) repeat protein
LRLAALLLLGPVPGIVPTDIARAQRSTPAAALEAEVDRLYKAGKYAEATEIANEVRAIREKTLGAEHPEVGTWLNDLAVLYRAQGRYRDAEPLYRCSLAIRETVLGPEHATVGQSLNRQRPQPEAVLVPPNLPAPVGVARLLAWHFLLGFSMQRFYAAGCGYAGHNKWPARCRH